MRKSNESCACAAGANASSNAEIDSCLKYSSHAEVGVQRSSQNMHRDQCASIFVSVDPAAVDPALGGSTRSQSASTRSR